MTDTSIPSQQQKQRAAWDLLLLDIEARTEQVRQLKAYEPWRLVFAGLTSGAAILAVGVAIGHWIVG
jgi:hypothetical protein